MRKLISPVVATITQFDTEHQIEIEEGLLEGFEEEGYTYLHCTCYTSPKYSSGWWICINESTYLINSGSNEKLKLLNAINIPLSPEKHYFKKLGDSLRFTLVFPALPKDWKNFNLIEIVTPIRALYEGSDGFSIINIRRNNTGVYKVKIS